MEFRDIPQNVQEVCNALVDGLKDMLHGKLYGVYLYGAAVFPDSEPVTDIDCHVILREVLNDRNREDILRLYGKLAKDYPFLGGELDIWHITLDDARKNSPPPNQLKSGMRDQWWALHCAHVRAGRYITLYGPEPDDIFPAPSWEEITAALDHEMEYIKNNLKYPAYCVLNLCRIMYSFQEQEVVVSKRFSGIRANEKFPEWSSVIRAALRTYEGKDTPADERRLQAGMDSFLEFSLKYIDENRSAGETDAK
ncbi:aminoglycoside adenylyltransferase domain-containing protein [Chloroflexota bacterium]